MKKERTLLKNTLIYAIGNFGSKMLTFLLLPLYTYYLTTSEYGYFDLVLSTITLCIPIITLQVNDGMYRDLLDCNKCDDISMIFSNTIIIIFRNIIVLSLFYVILLQFMDFRGKYLIIAQLIFTIIYNVWGQAARGLKKNKEYSIAGVLVTLINLLSNLLLLIVFNLNVEGLIISNTIGYVVAIVYLEYKLRIYSYIDLNKINLNYRRKLYLYSIPLIWNNISWWFMNVSDRYMLTYWKGIEANGIYAIANKLPALIMMINSFFSLAWQDSAITEYKSKDMNEYYTKIFNIYMKIQLTLMIVLLAFTKVILRYMVSSEFFISWRYIPPIYIASIFSSFSVFYGTGYLMAKDTKGSLYTSMIGCLANILINIYSIPTLGIQGAAISTMISYFFVWIFRIKQTKKYFNIKIDKKNFVELSIIIIIYTIEYYTLNQYLDILFMNISLIIVVVYNKNFLTKIIKNIRYKLQ